MATIFVTPAIGLDEGLITERFVRASGPGGQNVNKVASAVELRFDLRSSSLPADLRIGLPRSRAAASPRMASSSSTAGSIGPRRRIARPHARGSWISCGWLRVHASRDGRPDRPAQREATPQLEEAARRGQGVARCRAAR